MSIIPFWTKGWKWKVMKVWFSDWYRFFFSFPSKALYTLTSKGTFCFVYKQNLPTFSAGVMEYEGLMFLRVGRLQSMKNHWKKYIQGFHENINTTSNLFILYAMIYRNKSKQFIDVFLQSYDVPIFSIFFIFI